MATDSDASGIRKPIDTYPELPAFARCCVCGTPVELPDNTGDFTALRLCPECGEELQAEPDTLVDPL